MILVRSGISRWVVSWVSMEFPQRRVTSDFSELSVLKRHVGSPAFRRNFPAKSRYYNLLNSGLNGHWHPHQQPRLTNKKWHKFAAAIKRKLTVRCRRFAIGDELVGVHARSADRERYVAM